MSNATKEPQDTQDTQDTQDSLGCSNHWCFITGTRGGAGTNSNCRCVSGALAVGGFKDRIALENAFKAVHDKVEARDVRIAELEAMLDTVVSPSEV